MHRLVAVVVLLAVAACSTTATAPSFDLSGGWVGSAAVTDCPAGSLTEQVELQQSGDSLSGTYSLQDSSGHMSSGPIDNAYIAGDSIVFDSGWDTFRGLFTGQ